MNQTPPKVGRYPADSPDNIIRTLDKGNETPFDKRFSAGEVGTIDAATTQCFDYKNGVLVEVKCPDVVIVVQDDTPPHPG